jgi:hypothetical protein
MAAAASETANTRVPKIFEHLLATLKSGQNMGSHYFEFEDDVSLNAENIQTFASLIKDRPTVALDALGLTLRKAAIGDHLAPLIGSLHAAKNLTQLAISNVCIGDACIAALTSAIDTGRTSPSLGLNKLELLDLSSNCFGDDSIEKLFALLNSPTAARLDERGVLVRKAYPLPILRCLNLRSNSISLKGAAVMAASFRAGVLPSLRAPQFGGGGAGLYVDSSILLGIFSAFEKRSGGLGTWCDHEVVRHHLAAEQLAAKLQEIIVVEVCSNESGNFGWRIQSWNSQLIVAELADDGPAHACGIKLFDELLSMDEKPLGSSPSDAALLNQSCSAHTAVQFKIFRPPPGLKMALGKPTWAGAMAVVELMKNGKNISFSGHWGQQVVSLVDDGRSILTESEDSAGGPGIGEAGCRQCRQPLQDWLPCLLQEGYVSKISGWLK